MTNPTDTIIALEKALEAGPTPGMWECQDESKFSPDEPYWIGAQHPLCGFVSHAVVRSGCTEADELGDMKANAAFIAAANPLAIRTLLDAHASALKDAARYRWLEQRFLGADFRWGADEESGDEGCQTLIFKWPGNPVWGDLSMTLDAAMAALDDNTKGAAE